MKLLLDEMHAPRITQTLADEGGDVVSAANDPELCGLSDEDLLSHATRTGRAVVTENVSDFSILARDWAGEGRNHAGIVFTSPTHFDRASLTYPGNVTNALRRLLSESTETGPSWTRWL